MREPGLRSGIAIIAFAGSAASCGALAPVAFAAGEDASNVGRGSPAQYVKVTGRGFAGEAQGTDLRVRVAEIRLESTGKLAATRYTALGIAVYRQGEILGASWNHGVAGDLTPAVRSQTLATQTFLVPWAGSPCLKGGCEVRLQLRVEPGSADAHAEHTDFAALPVTAAPVVAQPVSPPRKSAQPAPRAQPKPFVPQTMQGWEYRILLANKAMRENRYQDAGRLLNEALAFVEKAQGPGRPGAARVRFQMHIVHQGQKNHGQQEQALLDALAILEKYPDAVVQKQIGSQGGALDKEIAARRLADFYWDARRYDQAYVYYDRAYRHVADIQLPDAERNRRLARNSAGRMAGACTQQNWAVADQAMKELKERIVKVDAETRRQLEYWIRTGEPRLAARKC
jgi:tetratricopeptide (TPR) repeat protein